MSEWTTERLFKASFFDELTAAEFGVADWELYSDDSQRRIAQPLIKAFLALIELNAQLSLCNFGGSLELYNEYGAMIKNGQHDSELGIQIRTTLVSRLGDDNGIIHNLDRLIRWQRFKRFASPK
jgi:hypothetical protein